MNKLSKYMSLVFSIISIGFLFNGELTGFMGFQLLAAFSAGGNQSILAACATDVELEDISFADDCNTRGGISRVYWARFTDIDWDAMAASAAAFDQTTECIRSYIMMAGATFKNFNF